MSSAVLPRGVLEGQCHAHCSASTCIILALGACQSAWIMAICGAAASALSSSEGVVATMSPKDTSRSPAFADLAMQRSSLSTAASQYCASTQPRPYHPCCKDNMQRHDNVHAST